MQLWTQQSTRDGPLSSQNTASLEINTRPENNIKDTCKEVWTKWLAVSQIVLGILAMTFQLGAIIDKSGIYYVWAGIWAGAVVSNNYISSFVCSDIDKLCYSFTI